MENTWKSKWEEDINYLKQSLIKNHGNLFFKITKEEFDIRVNELKNKIDELDYEEMKIEMSRVVASIKDAHTSLYFPASHYIPLKFYWFENGVYIIEATEKYKKLLYKRVLSIEGVEIEKVIKELSEIISFENESFFKSQSMKYLQVAEVLYGLLIVDDVEEITIETELGEEKIQTTTLEKIQYVKGNTPFYLKNPRENLWSEILGGKEIYIKYNSCRENGDKKISEKIREIIKSIEENSIEKVTLDLRNNLGGDSTLIRPLIDYLKTKEKINKKENLKVVIGRETFSSALLNSFEMKFETNCLIVGEPSGGKPNCYGEILRFTLPNSKFVVSYSTKYYKLIEDDEILSLYPDEIITESIEDYINASLPLS